MLAISIDPLPGLCWVLNHRFPRDGLDGGQLKTWY